METIQKVKVSNMTSPRENKEVPNQLIITTDEGQYFQSYKSIIAFKSNPTCTVSGAHNECKFEQNTVLDINKWDYSTTTGKYRNQFLGEDKKETQRKIDAGIYKLVDLNA